MVCGDRRLADDLGGHPHGLGSLTYVLSGLTDFCTRVALLFGGVALLLGAVALCLSLLSVLFCLYRIDLLGEGISHFA